MAGRDLVKIEDVTVVRSTEKAGLYRTADGEEFWCPWSQADVNSVGKEGETGDLWIPRWLAEDKEIEYLEEGE